MRRSFGYLTKEGFRNLWANRLMSFASVAVLLSCMIMIGSAFMLLVNIQSVIDSIEEKNVIMVYVVQDADEAAVAKLGEDLNAISYVSHTEFVDKETAFQKEIEALGTDATYFEGVENPLPDLYKVSVNGMENFDSAIREIEKLPNVDTIRDDKDIATVLINVRSSVTYLSVGIILLLMLVSLFIISNTIRITMFSRRLEISIMKSVGATNGFIRWPFVIEGILLGVISAVVSLGAVWGVYEVVKGSVSDMLGSVVDISSSLVPFTDYIIIILAAFLIIGILSGVVGSMVSIQRYLKEQGGVTYEEDD